MVVRGQSLFVYTDQKSYKAAPDQPYKGESPLDLRGATITVASDYTKKKHVFRVKWVLSVFLTAQTDRQIYIFLIYLSGCYFLRLCSRGYVHYFTLYDFIKREERECKISYNFFRSQSGSDFLFQAKDDSEMNEWVTVLNQAAQGTSGAGTSRAHTLPAPTQAETKRRSFFTLKKKWVSR